MWGSFYRKGLKRILIKVNVNYIHEQNVWVLLLRSTYSCTPTLTDPMIAIQLRQREEQYPRHETRTLCLDLHPICRANLGERSTSRRKPTVPVFQSVLSLPRATMESHLINWYCAGHVSQWSWFIFDVLIDLQVFYFCSSTVFNPQLPPHKSNLNAFTPPRF